MDIVAAKYASALETTIEVQKDKIESLKKDIEFAVECIEFYARNADDDDSDDFCHYDNGIFVTYKRAKETLLKIKAK